MVVDAQSQFRELLKEVTPLLPAAVAMTCEGLSDHGKWDLALSHCRYHLQSSDAVLSERGSALLAVCIASQDAKVRAEAEKRNRITAALSFAIASIGIFLLSELLSFSAVYSFCVYVPGVDNCGGHDNAGMLWLISFVIGIVATWVGVFRMRRRPKANTMAVQDANDA